MKYLKIRLYYKCILKFFINLLKISLLWLVFCSHSDVTLDSTIHIASSK